MLNIDLILIWRLFRTMRICPLLFSLCFVTSSLSTAVTSGYSSRDLSGVSNGLEEFNGLIVDSVEIDNRTIYNTSDPQYDNFIFRTANRLHATSRHSVIKREVLIEKGDLFSAELAEETARNLRNRLTLYNAWIEVTKLENDAVIVKVVTVDQWSLSGGIQYEQAGDDSKYRIWLEEKNFLGRNVLVSMENVLQSNEKDYFVARHHVKRVRGMPISLILEYSNNPRNSFRRISLSRPYFNLEQKTAFVLDVRKFGGRYDIYRDDLRISETEFDGDQANVSLVYRVGSYRKRLTYAYQHRYRFTVAETPRILSSFPEDSLVVLAESPEDSIYHYDELSLRFSHSEFWKTERIDGFGYIEDYITGQTASIGFARAFSPDYGSYIYDRVSLYLSHRIQFSSSLMSFDYVRLYWFKTDNELRSRSEFSFRYYNNTLKRFTLAMRGRYLADHSSEISNPLSLGGNNGLRGFDRFFKTGDRSFIGNIEGRFFTDLRFMSLVIGGVVFSDVGRTWKKGENFQFENFSSAIGFGLRIHFERAARGRVLRTDLSYSRERGWQITVGSGQYFPSSTVSL
jgi:hypothetical protein